MARKSLTSDQQRSFADLDASVTGYGHELVGSRAGHLEALARCLMTRTKRFAVIASSNNNAEWLVDAGIPVFESLTLLSGMTADFDFVLTTIQRNTGYDVTRMTLVVLMPYLCSVNVFTQLEGRINRYSQTAPRVRMMYVSSTPLMDVFWHKKQHELTLHALLESQRNQ